MSMSRPVKLVTMAAVWALFTLVGYLLVRHFGPGVSAELRDPPAVNAFRIDLALPDLEGNQKRLGDWRDGPMLINFWATWCPPCRKEIPMLKDLQERYRDRGLTVVGVAMEEAEPVRLYAQEMGFNYPVLIGEREAVSLATALGADIMALPISVFVDRHGNVVRQHLGEIHLEEAEEALVDILPPG